MAFSIWLCYLSLLSFILLASAELPVPTVKVNLDLPPAERWGEAVRYVMDNIGWEASFGPTFASHNTTCFDFMNETDFRIMAETLDKFWPELSQELRGICQVFEKEYKQYVSFEYLAAWVYYHDIYHSTLIERPLPPVAQKSINTRKEKENVNLVDFTRECTAILVQNKSKHVLHGRVMDSYPTAAKNLTLHLVFYKNNFPIYEAVDWYWFTVGFETAVKPGVISIQENWRKTTRGSYDAMLTEIQRGVIPQMFSFRLALEKNLTFWEFVNYFNNERLAAPYYLAMAGTEAGQAVVLSRDEIGSDHGFIQFNKTAWWLVQTNYDLWLPDAPNDARRTAAEQMLQSMGENVGTTVPGILKVMRTSPVRGPKTLYYLVMDPRQGVVEAYIY